MFWLARTFHNPLFASSEHEQIETRSAQAAHLVWYTARPRAGAARRQQDAYFKGTVEVVTMRSAWDDPNALFAGIKAGYNQVNHGHLDLGNFELDALGVRWARDLGADNYNLPGYWDARRGGQRWTYYRLNAMSHSVPLLGGKGQDPLAKSKFTKVEVNVAQPQAVVELTEATRSSPVGQRGFSLWSRAAAVPCRMSSTSRALHATTTDAQIEARFLRDASW
jgi:hypothetical protein